MHRSALLLLLLGLLAPTAAGALPQLRYAGATTLQKDFMPEAARLFETRTGVGFVINGGNTGPGLDALRAGSIDLAGSGRFLTPEERAAGLHETLIGWDALAVLVHESNPLENLSLDQLQGVFSGRIRNWQEVGGPDQPILVVASPRGSGMRAAVETSLLEGADHAPGAIVSAIVAEADRQVSRYPVAICAISTSMVDAPHTKILRVEGLLPGVGEVADGRYPLKKPLLLVTRGEPEGLLADFLELARGPEGQQIIGRSFFPVRPR